jgi:non-homologous end joining protein Ku
VHINLIKTYLKDDDIIRPAIKYGTIYKNTVTEIGSVTRKGEYIVFNDEDFQKVYKKRTENIEILEFTGLDEIDPKFYEQPYYLEPAKGASKIYALLGKL